MAKASMKKFKRYDEGGEVSDKDVGLKSSKDEDVGFFQRLRMGNIDDPSSEAYKRFGAGRGKSERNPVGESVSVNQPMRSERDESVSVNEPRAVARPSMTTTAADMFQDYGIKAGRGSAGTSETVSPPKRGSAGTSETVRPSKPAAKDMPRDTGGDIDRMMKRGKSAEMPSGSPGRGKSAEMPADVTKMSANERTKRSVETNLEAARSGSGSTDTRSANERIRDSDIGSSISNYFKNFKTPAQRKAQEQKEKASKGYASGGSVSSASSRGDGIAQRGKTRGKMC